MTITMTATAHVDLVDVDLERDLQHRLAVARVEGEDVVVEVSPSAEPEERHRIEEAVRAHGQAALQKGLRAMTGPLAVDRIVGLGPHTDTSCPFASSELIPTPFG